MSNFFQTVSNDVSKLQSDFTGPNYKYYKYIRNPSELGMSGDGSIGALSNDIAGIIDYVELLVTVSPSMALMYSEVVKISVTSDLSYL